MSGPKVVEGEVDFHIPTAGKPTKTWYRVLGDLSSNAHRPLVILHGGPGASHDYLLSLTDLATSYSIPIVFYDQVGNGLSTHMPEKNGDTAFWTEQLYLDELDNLLAHLGIQDNYDLLGHSWGGMLGARHAASQPKGLKKLIISDSPADMVLWVVAQNELRTHLSQEVQDALTKHEVAGTTDSQEYQDNVGIFYAHYLCRVNPMPEEVQRGLGWIDKDPTVYHTMNGPSEFYITGPLKDWSIIEEAHKITAVTLLINGRYDEAQDSVVTPFFREIPKVKWVRFEKSSHMPHFEERERYMQVVSDFLKVE